jgi:tetratricopeptide (TPR) repeat protein
LGTIHQNQGNYVEAAKLYQQSLDISKELEDKQGIAATRHQLGMIHQDQGNYAEAVKLYQQSLDMAKELGDKQGIAQSLHQLGRIDEESGEYERALGKYAQTLSIFEELNDPNQESARGSISRLRDKMGEDAFNKVLDSLEGS